MKKLIKICILIIFCLGVSVFVHESEVVVVESTRNFAESKKIAVELFSNRPVTFYCGCQYDNRGVVDWNSCGYKPKSNTRRAKFIEWEHIMPAHHFGQGLQCWKEPICRTKAGKSYKGRRCCQKINKQFIKMEADLHNLVPEIGELNAARSNYTFGLLPYITAQEFGACQIKIDAKNRMVEPRAKARGTIARTYLYMSAVYKIALTGREHKLFNTWSAEYPPEKWEIEWNHSISKIQGNYNPFIAKK